eukprot:TRINITY_DN2220_c0_g2_i1.p1 TRINITY_DN2220_c0_g2~~TRINITY_DN2220_c0_g2_i1.p1  ORF type:complete len:391 (-),score=52.36 TRINITY_DN2220_c0_g2_i1:71-1243(-)
MLSSSPALKNPSPQKVVDIFAAESPSNDKKAEKLPLQVVRSDARDDVEGYYCYRIGEVLNKRYQVIGSHGKGVFSNVIEAKDLVTSESVAIKLLRNNDHMKRTGSNEAKLLLELTNADPENKYNVIKLLTQFEEKGHLCLVLENMSLNLRQLVKKYGNNTGISIRAVRIYAYKLLRALVLLKRLSIIHSDVKPDNILVSADLSTVKLGDFGSALYMSEVMITPLLVSRYYRSPEIVLGSVYGYPVDIFSLGACLFEIATGSCLFPSRDNNHHLKLIMEVKGPFPKKVLSKCEFKSEYFDYRERFLLRERDEVMQKEIVKETIIFSKPTRDITVELHKSYGSTIADEEKKMVSQLADLIHHCLELNPVRRITPEEALKHSLFSTQPPTNPA